MPSSQSIHLYPASLASAVAALRSSQLDLHASIDQTCDRIERIDGQVESFLPEAGRRSRLHNEADRLLAAYPEPANRPALFGALVGVKDIFHVDGFVTRAGSQLPPELFAGKEAACVGHLREQGALILGKTVTTEFAYFEPGPTRNPHHLEHTPGGSSSGSAAAVATGLCALALGTQTIGSVIRPAAFCGIVGYKPTLDRIPSAGLVYFSPTIDHVGLFTQDMASMKLAAGALLRDWRADSPVSRRPILGVPAGPYMAQAERDAILAFEEHLRRLEWEGYHIERVPTLFEVQKLNLLHRRMVFAEFAQQHAHMYEQHADKYRPRTRQIIETGKTVSGEEAAAARANCLALRHELHARMADYDVDLWVTPAAVGAAPYGIQATGDPNMNLPWTHAGMPALTLPAGHDENDLPFGLQFVAHFGADEELMAWAGEIEAALQRTA